MLDVHGSGQWCFRRGGGYRDADVLCRVCVRACVCVHLSVCVCSHPKSGVFEEVLADTNIQCLFTLLADPSRLSPLQLLLECYPVCMCVSVTITLYLSVSLCVCFKCFPTGFQLFTQFQLCYFITVFIPLFVPLCVCCSQKGLLVLKKTKCGLGLQFCTFVDLSC